MGSAEMDFELILMESRDVELWRLISWFFPLDRSARYLTIFGECCPAQVQALPTRYATGWVIKSTKLVWDVIYDSRVNFE